MQQARAHKIVSFK